MPTVTATRSITAPAVTETTTRTTTRTVTSTQQAQDPNPRTVLGFGSQGPAVTQLQQDLAALGLYQGQPTGSYDAETRAGVRAFQGGFGVTGTLPASPVPPPGPRLRHAAGRA